ncbi:ATP-binding cassette domain-containing protein [Luteimonas sp. FXH3W]|uniref:ATP-binding protein Uup n=1 Tax=Aquilutibacter rugosus TaxID=3115820 RepID=A0ABU7V1F9_9GAMM
MSLVAFQNVIFAVGGPPLLDNAQFTLERGERVAVIGRNGAGKSTFLKLIAGEHRPDEGEVRVQTGVRISRLEQEVPNDWQGPVFDVVAQGLGDVGGLLARWHDISHDPDPDLSEMASLQTQIEEIGGWELERRVEQALQRVELDGELDMQSLSGGMKRRVGLARALVQNPDVLLLDEPTNHLDLESIQWLEKFLLNWPGATVFITHDRRFLRSLATRIVEIDRGELSSWPGDYANFLRRRDERMHAQAQEQARFDKLLAQEEVWIRQGIKARRTRDEGRVRRLKAMRDERSQRRNAQGNVRMEISSAQGSGKRVFLLDNVTHGFSDRCLIRDFSSTVLRGDRIGLVGPNGTGKSTLIKLLLGQMQPDQGQITIGTQLQVAYFDQYRSILREDWNALENVAEGRDFVEINGARKHPIGYLQEFLFSPERARAPISALSGGERNRLLLAKLFAQPSNLLVMDEPTNDLDVETLELLEELLADYSGTLLLVSHDREFLDNVTTQLWVFEGDGQITEVVGGYEDWERQAKARENAAASASSKPQAAATVTSSAVNETPKRKLSYKEQRELEQLPPVIDGLEQQIAQLTAQLSDPAIFGDPAALRRVSETLEAAQAELDAAYARWTELE